MTRDHLTYLQARIGRGLHLGLEDRHVALRALHVLQQSLERRRTERRRIGRGGVPESGRRSRAALQVRDLVQRGGVEGALIAARSI